jgi:hypothetical protein
MQTEFLFYGCWNRIDCESTDTTYRYRDIVLDYIEQSEKLIEDVYIAGDNWYPNMIKQSDNQSVQYYFTSILKSGYDKIYALQKNTYIVLGNHDEETIDPSDPQRRTCMLNTQRYYLDNITDRNIRTPSLELLDAVYNRREKPVLKRHNSLSLLQTRQSLTRQDVITRSMTTRYLSTRPKIMLYDDIEIVIKPNYIMILINTNRIHNDGYLTKLEEHIGIYKNTTKPIFVMGHLPIFYFRYKEDKTNKQRTPYFRQMKTELLKEDEVKNNDIKKLYDILSDNNCIYLCADTHCFEIMNIQPKNNSNTLVQIVAGTGGGSPDIVTSDNSDFDNTSGNGNDNDFVSSYTITGTCGNSYGYVKIVVDNQNKINVHYVKVLMHDDKKLDQLKPEQYTYSIIKNNVRKWVYNKPDNNIKPLHHKEFNSNAYGKDELCQLSTTTVVYSNSDEKKSCFEKEKKAKNTDK